MGDMMTTAWVIYAIIGAAASVYGIYLVRRGKNGPEYLSKADEKWPGLT